MWGSVRHHSVAYSHDVQRNSPFVVRCTSIRGLRQLGCQPCGDVQHPGLTIGEPNPTPAVIIHENTGACAPFANHHTIPCSAKPPVAPATRIGRPSHHRAACETPRQRAESPPSMYTPCKSLPKLLGRQKTTEAAASSEVET